MAAAPPSPSPPAWSDEVADPFELPDTDARDPFNESGQVSVAGPRHGATCQIFNVNVDGGACMEQLHREQMRHYEESADVTALMMMMSAPVQALTFSQSSSADIELQTLPIKAQAAGTVFVERQPTADDNDDGDATSSDVRDSQPFDDEQEEQPDNIGLVMPTARELEMSHSSAELELQTLPIKIPQFTFAPPTALRAASTDLEGSISLDASTNHLLMQHFAASVTAKEQEKKRLGRGRSKDMYVAESSPTEETLRGVAMVPLDGDSGGGGTSFADSQLNFTVREALPEAPYGIEEIEPGHIRKRQRVNPVAYLTILGALAITAACLLMQFGFFPTSALFYYVKMGMSPFSTIFGALMTYLFNDMHGFHVDFSQSDGYFSIKRYTAVTWLCFGAKVREFSARDLRSVKIVYPWGSPNKAAIVFETARGHFAAGRQQGFCRCNVSELEEEARFWVYIASANGAKCQYDGVQVNKFLPPMY